MRNIISSPQNPSGNPRRVIIQATPNSNVNTTTSSNEGQKTRNLELSTDEVFEINITQHFSNNFLVVLTTNDAVLKEVRDCSLQNDKRQCMDVNSNMPSYCRDLHVRSRCACIDKPLAISKSIKEAVLESLHLTDQGSWGMISLGQYAFWPYMNRKILNKADKCKH